jgi:AcrR family transcriptional regulator
LKNKGKQQRSRDTIQTILSAAGQVLIDHGYEKATTNRIAEYAGYSVGTLYQYFDNKEDIYGELVDQIAAAANCPVKDTLEITLKELLYRILNALEQNPALIQSIEALLVGRFRDKRAAGFESIVDSISRLLEAHRDEIVVKDLGIAARILVGASEGLANGGKTGLASHEDLEKQALRLQLAYLTMKD